MVFSVGRDLRIVDSLEMVVQILGSYLGKELRVSDVKGIQKGWCERWVVYKA